MELGIVVIVLFFLFGMDMLVILYVNCNGIYLWVNRLMYFGVVDVILKGSSEVFRVVFMLIVGFSKEDEVDEDVEVLEVVEVVVIFEIRDVDGEIVVMRDFLIFSFIIFILFFKI